MIEARREKGLRSILEQATVREQRPEQRPRDQLIAVRHLSP
jgi:hypothetical protein